MRLSTDQLTLQQVEHEDIIDGSCIIPDGVTKIGPSAFFGCRDLKQIVIPDGVTEIGENAFAYCYELIEISLPISLTKIGPEAFSECITLPRITLPDGITKIDDLTFNSCHALTEIRIPDGVTVIGERAFSYCQALKEMALPNSVTRIGDSAFVGCHGFKEIVIPNRVTAIGEHTFTGCRALTKIILPDGVTAIGERAFSYCLALKDISLPNSVTAIGSHSFLYCSALAQIIIPAGITEIGEEAFINCNALTLIVVTLQNNETLASIKNLLPAELADKTVEGALYKQVLAYQAISYQNHIKPLLGEHKAFYALLISMQLRFNQKTLRLHTDLIKIIASFDEQCFDAFKQSMSALPFPRNEEEFKQYKQDCKPLFSEARRVENMLAQEANELFSLENISEIGCKSKLTTYCLYIKKQKKIKQDRQPMFFSDNEPLSLQIEAKLQAVKKVIDFLSGNKEIVFTLNDMAYLENGFIGNCLRDYDIVLPQTVQADELQYEDLGGMCIIS